MVFHDPATGLPIATLEDERARADSAETARDADRARDDAEQTHADTAEARVRELEERLR
ncbi:MAG: hypothetical protein OXI91_16670 [Chloroflexota bacterium]|nr:hypothetical protein [Chloroflexota bacterium]